MLFTLVVFVIVLAVMVFFHELGHFGTARKLGVKCDEFGFGFPPRICGWRKVNGKRNFFWGNKPTEDIKSDDTIYSMNWIPIGGFVKIKGENGEDSKDDDSFGSKKIWKRTAILSAGVTMNVVLAMVCLSIAFMIGAPQPITEDMDPNLVRDQKIQVVSVISDTPAEEQGVQLGDVLVSINDQKFETIEQVQGFTNEHEGEELSLKVERLGEEKDFKLTTTILEQTGKSGMGVGLSLTGIVKHPWYQSIWYGILATFNMLWMILVAFATVIKNAVMGQPIGVEVAGPVGIAAMTGQVARMGFNYILQFTALLSLNLAIINFLPFPALDGGRVLFLIIEKIRGKAVNQKVEQIAHTIGFALLMLLILVVTGRDILQFKEFFINLWDKIIP